MADVTLNGTVYTDAMFAGVGYVPLFPEQIMTDFLAQAQLTLDAYVATQTTSVSNVLIGTGSKTFVLDVDKPYQPGQSIVVAYQVTPTTHQMTGMVTSYTPATKTLIFTVNTTAGTGTYSSWYVSISGVQGVQGLAGSGAPPIIGGDALKIVRLNAGETAYENVVPLDARGRYVTKNTTYTAVDGDLLSCDTSGGAFTVTLPLSPSAGDEIRFLDETGSFAANNLTIDRNGETIMGAAEDLLANGNNETFGLVYVGSDWRIV